MMLFGCIFFWLTKMDISSKRMGIVREEWEERRSMNCSISSSHCNSKNFRTGPESQHLVPWLFFLAVKATRRSLLRLLNSSTSSFLFGFGTAQGRSDETENIENGSWRERSMGKVFANYRMWSNVCCHRNLNSEWVFAFFTTRKKSLSGVQNREAEAFVFVSRALVFFLCSGGFVLKSKRISDESEEIWGNLLHSVPSLFSPRRAHIFVWRLRLYLFTFFRFFSSSSSLIDDSVERL